MVEFLCEKIGSIDKVENVYGTRNFQLLSRCATCFRQNILSIDGGVFDILSLKYAFNYPLLMISFALSQIGHARLVIYLSLKLENTCYILSKKYIFFHD